MKAESATETTFTSPEAGFSLTLACLRALGQILADAQRAPDNAIQSRQRHLIMKIRENA